MTSDNQLGAWPDEPAERLLGIEIRERSATHAMVELTVGEAMLNGHEICHGGVLFLVADTAMAHASNSVNPAVASHAEIDFLQAVPNGALLRATARQRRRRKKLAIWDVLVVIVEPDGTETAVAEFRGRTLEIGRGSDG